MRTEEKTLVSVLEVELKLSIGVPTSVRELSHLAPPPPLPLMDFQICLTVYISYFVLFLPDILRRLLEHDFVVDLVDHVERNNGRAPLHLAAKFNHVEIARELLQHGAKLDREDTTGKSPLYMAASGGHADMLKVFLEHGRLPFSALVYVDCV